MSNQNVQALASSTGTFQVVPLKAEQAPAAGKAQPEAGKEPPVPAREKPDLEALAAS